MVWPQVSLIKNCDYVIRPNKNVLRGILIYLIFLVKPSNIFLCFLKHGATMINYLSYHISAKYSDKQM